MKQPYGLVIIYIPDRETAYGFFSRYTPQWLHVLFYRFVVGGGMLESLAMLSIQPIMTLSCHGRAFKNMLESNISKFGKKVAITSHRELPAC